MLSQAWYWSNNKAAKARGGWFYKSQEDWEEETGLTRREQETARRKLKERGLLEEKLAGVPATLHFRVNVEALFGRLIEAEQGQKPEKSPVQSSLAETCKLESPKRVIQFGGNGQTISETTSETTPENTHTNSGLRAVGAPAVVVGADSKFSLEDCRKYADHLHASGQGVTNPGGFARAIHKSGAEDSQIAAWLAEISPERVRSGELPVPAKIDASNCPDCAGRGLYFPDPAHPQKGVDRCRHPRLTQVA
jgi:hypothetical protein